MGVVKIPLTQGFFAIVDDADAALVLPYKWNAQHSPRRTTWYAARRAGNGCVWMHHVICPPPPGYTIDHIDGDGLDNRRENLRPATRLEQTRNRRPMSNKIWSRHKGVRWHRSHGRNAGHWEAVIKINGRCITRSAPSEIAAARLYNALAREHFGEFGWINLVPDEVA